MNTTLERLNLKEITEYTILSYIRLNMVNFYGFDKAFDYFPLEVVCICIAYAGEIVNEEKSIKINLVRLLNHNERIKVRIEQIQNQSNSNILSDVSTQIDINAYEPTEVLAFSDHTEKLYALDWSSDSKYIVTCSNDETAKFGMYPHKIWN